MKFNLSLIMLVALFLISSVNAQKHLDPPLIAENHKVLGTLYNVPTGTYTTTPYIPRAYFNAEFIVVTSSIGIPSPVRSTHQVKFTISPFMFYLQAITHEQCRNTGGYFIIRSNACLICVNEALRMSATIQPNRGWVVQRGSVFINGIRIDQPKLDVAPYTWRSPVVYTEGCLKHSFTIKYSLIRRWELSELATVSPPFFEF